MNFANLVNNPNRDHDFIAEAGKKLDHFRLGEQHAPFQGAMFCIGFPGGCSKTRSPPRLLSGDRSGMEEYCLIEINRTFGRRARCKIGADPATTFSKLGIWLR